MNTFLPRMIILTALNLVLAGCSSGPPALKPPKIDPQDSADGAMELYDKDGDGFLSAEELEACPGILFALKTYDQDGDGRVSRDEIAQRLQKLVDQRVAITRLVAKVRYKKRPLPGASVRFIPESYLGEAIKPAEGMTSAKGGAMIAVEDALLPENQRGKRAMQYGTFRVEITHPEVEIPAKYNTNTTLGYDTRPGNAYVTFDLKTR